jgi:hypothetical protein
LETLRIQQRQIGLLVLEHRILLLPPARVSLSFYCAHKIVMCATQVTQMGAVEEEAIRAIDRDDFGTLQVVVCALSDLNFVTCVLSMYNFLGRPMQVLNLGYDCSTSCNFTQR